jgi:DNA-binding CsgD family transcriptional regulator
MKMQERFGFAIKDAALLFLEPVLRPNPIQQIGDPRNASLLACFMKPDSVSWKAAGTLGLQWLDYLRLVRVHSGDIYIFLIAAAFLALGLFVGARVFGAPPPPANFDGNPKARAALGISASEMTVLEEIAAGRSNKEIAARLNISPNTVKTHAARLFEKNWARSAVPMR